jgi:hypothetical protein
MARFPIFFRRPFPLLLRHKLITLFSLPSNIYDDHKFILAISNCNSKRTLIKLSRTPLRYSVQICLNIIRFFLQINRVSTIKWFLILFYNTFKHVYLVKRLVILPPPPPLLSNFFTLKSYFRSLLRAGFFEIYFLVRFSICIHKLFDTA